MYINSGTELIIWATPLSCCNSVWIVSQYLGWLARQLRYVVASDPTPEDKCPTSLKKTSIRGWLKSNLLHAAVKFFCRRGTEYGAVERLHKIGRSKQKAQNCVSFVNIAIRHSYCPIVKCVFVVLFANNFSLIVFLFCTCLAVLVLFSFFYRQQRSRCSRCYIFFSGLLFGFLSAFLFRTPCPRRSLAKHSIFLLCGSSC